MNINEILKTSRLYMDGAMGSLMQEKLPVIGSIPEELNITQPSIIKEIHQAYIDAGADIILSNTFGANGYKLKGSKYSVEEIVAAGIKNVKALNPRFTALDMGPIGSLIGDLGEVSFEEAFQYFREIVEAGVKAGADLIVIETMTDIGEARAAVIAAKEVCDLPIIASMTYEDNQRTLTGSDPLTVVTILEGLGVDAIGINCSTGPDGMLPIVKELVKFASVPIMVEPNAGLPRILNGETVYDITTQEYAEIMVEIANLGGMILGGCCGTTPEYIKAVIDQTKDLEPYKITPKNLVAVASRTQTLLLGEDVRIIGECINPTTNVELQDALRKGDLGMVTQLAIQQKKAGANILDVNLGLPDIDERSMMVAGVEGISRVVDIPLQIDSSNPEVIEEILRSYPGKAIINSVNGKAISMATIFPIAKKYGALVLGLTMDENGIPNKAFDRFEIAEKILATGESYGISKRNFLIDCLVLTASAQQAEVKETLKALRMIRDQLKVPTVLGVSNISFGLPNRELLNRTFLSLALEEGLRNPIMNPGDQEMMDTIYGFRALYGFDEQCMDYANLYKAQKPKETENFRNGVLSLKEMIIEGQSDLVSETTEKLLRMKKPLDIINEDIIPGLDAVGDAFETGECFLPHLIFAAETAEKAFGVIKETMRKAGEKRISKGKILLATVEGDVHDIGKNILKVILENYGYEIIDLGKDVKAEKIMDGILRHNIHLVGLSALMTTTVKNMEKVVKEINANCPTTTVMVGGAVLNSEYAKAIGADYYGKDAREGANIARKVLG
ncbi:MAG: homocysteine S-methyltransferase family protein [Eubacteriaceae bacterium]